MAIGAYGDANYSDENIEVKGFGFNNLDIRRGFIRKVYSILCVQLLITVAIITWCIYNHKTKYFIQQHFELFVIALIVTIVCLIALLCCEELRRKTPTNYIFLSFFTLAQAFLLAVVSSTYDTDAVLVAAGITAAVCLGLSLFAFQTKWDFTVMGGILCIGAIILLIFSFVTIFVHTNIVNLIYACLGALIFSLYLVYDTQLMMEGKHKYSISPEEYIFAALNLYTDIINMFMHILSIIKFLRGKN